MYGKLLFFFLIVALTASFTQSQRHQRRRHLVKLHHRHHRYHKHHGHHYRHHRKHNIPQAETADVQKEQEALMYLKSSAEAVPTIDAETASTAPAQNSSGNKTTLPHTDIDVGKVLIESKSRTCNGVLLTTSLIITTASCVSGASETDIHFQYHDETLEVERVVINPRWKGGQSHESNFALLFLTRFVSEYKADFPVGFAWSPYALEDLDDSFLGNRGHVRCETASGKAKVSDAIRHAEEQSIIASCPNGNSFPGAPFYRLVDGHPTVYGLYNGICNNVNGPTASCGTRITKKDFKFICSTAETVMHISLYSCSSTILNILNPVYPTVVKSSEVYETLKNLSTNSMATLFVYTNSKDEDYPKILTSIEKIQRLKDVYPMFHVGVVDTSQEGLNFKIEKAPFIEFRVSGPFYPYNYDGKFSIQNFTRFMKKFGKVGAPPKGEIGTDRYFRDANDAQKDRNVIMRQVQSLVRVKPTNDGGCDLNAYASYFSQEPKCFCDPGFMGTGSPGKCKERLEAVKENCRYTVKSKGKLGDKVENITYAELISLTETDEWCEPEKNVFSYVVDQTESVVIAGEPLTPNDCASEVKKWVSRCQTLRENSEDAMLHCGKRSFLSVQTPSSANYRDNFLNNDFPDAFNSPPYQYYVYHDWIGGSRGTFSAFFNPKRGTPDITAYKLASTDMESMFNGEKRNQAMINSAVHGTEQLYADEIGNGQSIVMDVEGESAKKDVWKKYEQKIYKYARTKCHKRGPDAELHLLKGVSDVEILPGRATSILRPPNNWYASNFADCQLSSRHISRQQARSLWSVGCCTWSDSTGGNHGESISLWANNVGDIKPSYEHQPDLPFLASQLYPSASNFTFFPGNPNCNTASSHMAI